MGIVLEKDIVQNLTQFKEMLTQDCTVLIEDIWNNYKFYASQQKSTPCEEATEIRPSLMNTAELIVPNFESKSSKIEEIELKRKLKCPDVPEVG